MEAREVQKTDGVETGELCSLDVGGNVVGEEAFLGTESGAGDGGLVDFGRGLGGSDFVGKNQMVKMAEQGKSRADIFEMNFVGVRKQQQRIARGEIGKQRFGDQGIGAEQRGPEIAELVVTDLNAEKGA